MEEFKKVFFEKLGKNKMIYDNQLGAFTSWVFSHNNKFGQSSDQISVHVCADG